MLLADSLECFSQGTPALSWLLMVNKSRICEFTGHGLWGNIIGAGLSSEYKIETLWDSLSADD